MSYVIAVSGTHGTGKTTFVHRLAAMTKITHPTQNIKTVMETASECPLQHWASGGQSDLRAQQWIFARQLQKEHEARAKADIVILDRPVYDVIAYTMVIDEDMAAKMLAIQDLQYDKVFKMETDHLVDDGYRNLDEELRERVSHNLEHIYSLEGVKPVRVTGIQDEGEEVDADE